MYLTRRAGFKRDIMLQRGYRQGARLLNETRFHVLTVVIKGMEKEIPVTLHKERCEERTALLKPSLYAIFHSNMKIKM